MHVLHLIETPVPSGSPRGDAALLACAVVRADSDDLRHTTLLLGGTAAEARAIACGAATTDRICPPLRRPELAANSLQRIIDDRGDPDAIQCWSAGVVPLAASVRCATPPRLVLTPLAGASSSPRGFRRWPDRLVTCLPDESDLPGRAAFPAGRVVMTDPVWPGLVFDDARRSAARRALGLEEGDPTTVVVLLGDRPSDADAVRFGTLLALAERAGSPPLLGVASDAAGRWVRAARAVRQTFDRVPIARSGRPLVDLLRAADLALWAGGADRADLAPQLATGAVCVLAAAAVELGVPLVAAATPALARVVPESVHALCLASDPAVVELARLFVPMTLDPARRALVADELRLPRIDASGLPPFPAAVRAAWEGDAVAAMTPGRSVATHA